MKNVFPLSIILMVLIGCSSSKEWVVTQGQHPQHFEKQIVKTVSYDMLVYTPASTQEKKLWPLMVFLHGAGERGKDLMKLKVHSIPNIVDGKSDFPFIVVSPQCPDGKWWDAEALDVMLDDVIAKLPVDTNRIYLTGISMGGHGTWKLASLHPERFAAIAPVCGWGSLDDIWRLREMPIWVFHGAKDDVVPSVESDRMVERLQRMGNTQTKYTLYPDANHNAWDATYANPELYEWFLQHTKK